MNRKNLFLAVGLMMTMHLTAQNPGQDFTDRMNHIFQYVDKSKISTGLLSDYGLQYVEPKYFNGVTADSNYVDMYTWRMLYSGFKSSQKRIKSSQNFQKPPIFLILNVMQKH